MVENGEREGEEEKLEEKEEVITRRRRRRRRSRRRKRSRRRIRGWHPPYSRFHLRSPETNYFVFCTTKICHRGGQAALVCSRGELYV